ncbi:MAG: outer membrane lipoprotein carrier protein LolA [Rhodocyclaceae bacterium]|nr:MAG: outer membrane lipoprotein carrier protein LolA [Rhodocyclaceae bacterium]
MRWVTLFFLLPMSVQALSAESDTLSRIGAQMEQHPMVRADFIQSKQMPALKRPLVTSGRLVYSRRHGVLWQIEQPYRMSYVLGEDRIIEIAADGTRRERGLRDVPGLAQVGRVFRAMLGANTAALRDLFEVSVQGSPEKWEIDLKPRQAQLAQFLSGLQLSGGHYLESIRISEAGGETTQIRFRNTQGGGVPNEAELQLFGGEVGKP